MKHDAHDPWSEQASEYVDGELAPGARAAFEGHLGGCAECRAFVRDAHALRRLARELPAGPPARDGWPSLAAALAAGAEGERGPRRAARFAPLAAAALLAFLAGWLARGVLAGDARPAEAGERFLLVLHEPAEAVAGEGLEVAALVEEYRAWARGEREAGRLEGGEKLADGEGFELTAGGATPREGAGGLGGYFVVRARDYDQALAVARTCPHLRHGGWIEVRRIEET